MDNQIPPVSPVPPVPPVLPPAEKNKDWLKILLAAIGVLIILGLFGNIYLLAKNQKPVAEVNPIPTQVAATPTQDLTATWKTYAEQKFNFQFSYPPKYSLEIINKCEEELFVNYYECSSGNRWISLGFTTGSYVDGFFLLFEKNLQNLSVTQWLERRIEKDKIKCPSLEACPAVPPDIKGIQLERINELAYEAYSFKHFEGWEGWPPYVFRIARASKDIVLFMDWQDANPEPSGSNTFRENFDQILSTFKFLQ